MKKKILVAALLIISLLYLINIGSQTAYNHWANNKKSSYTDKYFLRIIGNVDLRYTTQNVPKSENIKKDVDSDKIEISYLLDGDGYTKGEATLLNIINKMVYILQKSLIWIAGATIIFFFSNWAINRKKIKQTTSHFKKRTALALSGIESESIDPFHQEREEVSSKVRKLMIQFDDQLPKRLKRKTTETLNQWSNRVNLNIDFDIYRKVRYGEIEETKIKSEEIDRLETHLNGFLTDTTRESIE